MMVGKLGVRAAMAHEGRIMMGAGLEPEGMLRTTEQEDRRDERGGEAMENGSGHETRGEANEVET